MNLYTRILTCFLLCFFSISLAGSIGNPDTNTSNSCNCDVATDIAVLLDIYNDMDGANWFNKWDLSLPVNTWHGISLNPNGCVEAIYLPGNGLEDDIPNSIGNLSEIKLIDFSYNFLFSEIPASIGNLSSLEYLNLSNTYTNFSFTTTFSNLVSLKEFYFFNNFSYGFLPLSIISLPNIEIINMSNNDLFGFFQGLGDLSLSNLTELNLSGNRLDLHLPDALSTIPNLTLLDLSDNEFEGCFPYNYQNFCGITVDFSGNPNLPGGGDFASFCTNSIGSCCNPAVEKPALIQMYAAMNGPAWTNTWDLSLEPKDWHGIVMEQSGCISHIILNNNNLSGNIPSAVGDFVDLKVLFLESNNITGIIPPEIEQLSKLEDLVLNNNNLSSTIPSFIGNMTKLQVLRLQQNNFVGAIPDELGKLADLHTLDLSNNNLTGDIPLELGNLNLVRLFLFSNNLSGCLHSNLIGLCNVPNISIGNNPQLVQTNIQSFCTTGAGQCCPTTEFLSGDISIGLYRAADNILSDGIAIPGGETEFKAGQLIKLLPGFNTSSSTDFKVNIESCVN